MEETRWLTAEQQRAWRRFAAVVMQLPGTLDTQLQQDAQITHFGYWVMAMLSEAPSRSLRMSELAALANGSQSRLSHLVGRLEERGWVRRERTPEDGRGYVAVLTDEGYQKVVETAPGHVEKVRSVVFDALTPEQITQLDEISAAVLARLDPDATC
ncbi:MarR family winged helix-turn-helix transcriptional regulator [Phytohabitans sp. LJ34]|uniref:MarR family winged helix-turn-helix transcriptional regulator n=1 Tax=Phytohabitans sp. LJ34 TaxID=3452217 RepID=UPI003F89B4BE